MKPQSQTMPAQLTYEDYCLIPDDGQRHEIIDGAHHVSPAPFTRHQSILLKLASKLYAFVEQHAVGSIWLAPVDVVFSDQTVVQPDLLFISNDRKHFLTEKNVQGAPDLVIEILSNSTRRYDEITKRKVYERFGVAEYWIVDPELEAMKVYRRENNAYGPSVLLDIDHEDLLQTPLLPGFQLTLTELFST